MSCHVHAKIYRNSDLICGITRMFFSSSFHCARRVTPAGVTDRTIEKVIKVMRVIGVIEVIAVQPVVDQLLSEILFPRNARGELRSISSRFASLRPICFVVEF